MATSRDLGVRQEVLALLEAAGLKVAEMERLLDVGLLADGRSFVVRVDYTAARGGGYQIWDGSLSVPGLATGYASPATGVLGRGRTTARKKLIPPQGKTVAEEIEDRRKALISMIYDTLLDDERIA